MGHDQAADHTRGGAPGGGPGKFFTFLFGLETDIGGLGKVLSQVVRRPGLERPFGVVVHGAEVTVPGRLPGSRQMLAYTLRRARNIIAAGGYISVDTGSAPDANLIPIPKLVADTAFDAAACIGCGACVAACPNASAMLFTGAKISHMNRLPQGQPERYERALDMVLQMEAEAFGSCSNHGACENACPKEIEIDVIAMLNRDYLAAVVKAG